MSAKYNMLYPPLVERIYAEERAKYKKQADAEKSAKTRLHQMYGAYVQGNIHKKATALLGELEEQDSLESLNKICVSIMGLHASTRERLPFIRQFYDFISAHTGKVTTVMDLGCGLNPFSMPFLGFDAGALPSAYFAYDIDMRTSELLNRFFSCLGMPQYAGCMDLAVNTPKERVDLAILCKLLPVLEAQTPGRGFQLVCGIDAEFIVITYPLKSLGGREKGMGRNYSAAFAGAMEAGLLKRKSGNFVLAGQASIGNELVFILK